jgi:alpha-tubulin suppressor-like RCC1 family protein
MPLSWRPVTLTVGLVAGISACLSFDPFACTDATACSLGGATGACVGGWCAYPDPECVESGMRYDENAGEGFGGLCVGAPGTSDTDPSGPGTTTMGTESTTESTVTSMSTTASTTNVTETGTTTDDSDNTCGAAGQMCCDGDQCEAGLTCLADQCGCVTGIVAGNRHTCISKANGSVWCWGANDLGQLGNQANAFESTPIEVGSDLGEGSSVAALSAFQTTCALRSDDIAICWGQNANAQVDFEDLVSTVLPPTQNSAAAGTSLIAAGGTHTCFGKSGASIATCFGDNTNGQLTTATPSPGPVDLSGTFQFAEMEAGNQHTCGRTAAGDVFCWGLNTLGQLGVDPIGTPTSAAQIQVTLGQAADLAVGRNHTCARVGNEVHCWGQNANGELGDGTGTPQFSPATLAMLPAQLTVAELISYPDSTCALMTNGDLFCWGSNAFGQLRLPPDKMGEDQVRTLTPQQIDLDGLLAVDVAGGATHSCIRTDIGEVYCWGTNTQGQIGNGSTAFALDPTLVEVTCP